MQYNVPTLGKVPDDRPEGVFRWMYCQVNGASHADSRKTKAAEIMHLVNKYSVQGVAIAEHGTNFSTCPSYKRLSSWFNRDKQVTAREAWNKHQGEDAGNHLQGGTGLLAFEELRRYVKGGNNDFRRLGRWCSWKI